MTDRERFQGYEASGVWFNEADDVEAAFRRMGFWWRLRWRLRSWWNRRRGRERWIGFEPPAHKE